MTFWLGVILWFENLTLRIDTDFLHCPARSAFCFPDLLICLIMCLLGVLCSTWESDISKERFGVFKKLKYIVIIERITDCSEFLKKYDKNRTFGFSLCLRRDVGHWSQWEIDYISKNLAGGGDQAYQCSEPRINFKSPKPWLLRSSNWATAAVVIPLLTNHMPLFHL